MITRLILSLKKATKTPDAIWNAGQVPSIKFARRRTIGGTEHGREDAIHLRSFVVERRSASEL